MDQENLCLTGEELRGFPVYNQMPSGWKVVKGALTVPLGYILISNCESYFGDKRKTGLVSEMRRTKTKENFNG